MSVQSRTTLKNWFKKNLKPLESQFADWIDSFIHKTDDSIAISYVTGLQTLLNSFATSSQISDVIGGAPTAGNTLNKLYNLITAIGQFAGSYNASGGGVPTGGTGTGGTILKGDYWIVNVGGTVSGLGVLKPGDVVWSKVASANTGSQFFAVETNDDLATPTVMGLVKLVQSISGSGAADETLSTAGIYSALAALNRNLSQVLSVGNDAGAQQIKNIANPTSAQDAVSKNYADTYLGAHALPSLSAGFLKYSGSAWVIDASTYLTTISGISAGGDLSGTYANPTVAGLKGAALPALSAGFLKYSGSAWVIDASTYLTTISGISAGGDLSGTYANPTVAGLKGAALPSLSAGFLKYSGSAWAFDATTYLTQTSGDARYLQLSGGTLTGPLILSGDGSAALHPVSFQQFSNALQGLQPKPTARAKTTGALPANTYANGTSGVGATLTGNSNGALAAQDGVSLTVGDVLFVTNEAASANNGLYTVTQLGDGSHPYILTRSIDMDASSEFNGSFIIVDNEGTANKNTLWIFNYVGGFATGTSSVTFTNLNPATSYLAGSGLSLSGVTFSIAAGGVTNSMIAASTIDLTAKVTGILPIASGGTNASSASITAFNNITGYTASGATGTTSTNLVFSASPAFTGTPTLGTLGYSDTGILFSLQSSTNSYNQFVIQNTNSGASASSSFIINNNNSTASTYFGEFGINSGAFTGSGSFNLANAVYLTSTSGDLVVGTTTNNTFRVVTNNSTTDRFSIDGSGVFTFNAPTQGNLFKASANIDFWQMQNSSGTVLGLENSSDAVKTLCTGSGTGSSTTITVTSTTGFASSGLAMLDNFEIFSYTGITSNSLTGCTRGLYGTTAISWNSSDAVANIPLFRGTSSTNISYFIYKSLSNNKTVMNFQNAWWRGDSYVSDGSLFVTKLNGGTGNIYFSSSSLSGSSAVASIGGGSNQINIGGINSLAITQYNVANASDLRLFSITDAAFSTARTASTELTMMDINISSVQQLSTGSLTLQRFTRWRQPGLKFVGASAVTDMANFEIDGAAIAGDNNTTTNTHGLLIKSVLSVVTGTGAATNAFGATINAPTGATNNFAAQFVGNTTKFIGLGSSTQKIIDAYQSDGTTNVLFLKDNGDFQVGLSSSKFGVLGSTAISKVTTSISAASFVSNSSGISNDSATWGGYTVGQAIQAMINYGFLT